MKFVNFHEWGILTKCLLILNFGFFLSGILMMTAISIVGEPTEIRLIRPEEGDLVGTDLPNHEAMKNHLCFQWQNPTQDEARLSLVYEKPFRENPTAYKKGQKIPLLITGPGDQKIFWNPPDNIYDGVWRLEITIGELSMLSPTFVISSQG